MKYTILLYLLITTVLVQAQKTSATNALQKLPDCVTVKDGKLTVKEGYVMSLSKDGKTAEVRRQGSKEIEGTFRCACESSGTCNLSTQGGSMICGGTCNCTLSIVVKGIKYMVNAGSGTMTRIQ